MQRPWATFLSTFLPLLLALFVPRVCQYFGLTGTMTRPRSSIAQIMVNKLNSERNLQLQESGWYSVNLEALQSQQLRTKFVQLEKDEETANFIAQCIEKSDWIFTQIYHNFAKAFLSFFYSQTDINAMLNRGSMFVLSKHQFAQLTAGGSLTDRRWQSAGGREPTADSSSTVLLDLGAGDGRPTLAMAGGFGRVVATEASRPMQKLLAEKGFQLIEIDQWVQPEGYDVVSCLNLLDRCDKPLSMLQGAWTSLKTAGVLVVALVLPFRPYVEVNPNNKPSEELSIEGTTKEKQLEAAVHIIEGIGFELESWSRVPYLCEGDLNQPLYSLDDYVMLFTKKARPTL